MNETSASLHTPDSNDPSDGRKMCAWESKYPKPARLEIRCEAVYLIIVLICAYILILLTWNNSPEFVFSAFSPEKSLTLRRYAFYAFSGMLGGAVFGIKYFYRVVARGWWHQDRRIWRIKSPFMGMSLGFIFGAMLESGVMRIEGLSSTPGIVSVGFLVGYCADTASAKMIVIANAIFGIKEK